MINAYGLDLLISEEQIEERVWEISEEITKKYIMEDDVVLVGILKGSFIFLSDLSRKLAIPHSIDFISISSYGEKGDEQGEVKLLLDVSQNLSGKHVILIEDIVDSGNTIRYLKDIFKTRHIKSLEVCSLLKRGNRNLDSLVDYCGFVISEDKWVVGYGLDYKEENRTLPAIYAMITP